jgi:hypothetical protein
MNLFRFDTTRPWTLLALVWSLIVATSPIGQLVWGTNKDTSWLITVIERLTDGEVLYRDILELNPPFSIWLYEPPVLLALSLDISPEWLVHFYTVFLSVLGLGLTAWIAQSGKLLSSRSIAIVTTVLLIALVFLSGNIFAQREHIGTALIAPILALAAWRASGLGSPTAKHWMAAGLAASVLPMVKPHYIPVVLMSASWLSVRKQSLKGLLLPEYLIAGFVFSVYVLIAYLTYPDFFNVYMPLLRELYTPIRQPVIDLVSFAIPSLLMMVIYFVIFPPRTTSNFSSVLLLAALSAWLSFFILGKGWGYHAYPAIFLGSSALLVAMAEYIERMPQPLVFASLRFKAITIAIAVVMCHRPFYDIEKPSDQLVDTIKAQYSNPTVSLLGADIAIGHPLTRLIHGDWREPYCSDWLAAHAFRLSKEAGDKKDSGAQAHLIAVGKNYLEVRRQRLTRDAPDLLIVDTGDFLVDWMLTSGGYDKLLDSYSLLASDNGTNVYQRSKSQNLNLKTGSPSAASD